MLRALGVLMSSVLLSVSCAGPSSAPETDAGTERPSRVYHVQLDMTKDKAKADRMLGDALDWWQTHASSLKPEPLNRASSDDRAPVAIAWKAPLYRVRLGPFASRTAAEEVLSAAQSSFPQAFIAPERLQNRQ